MEQQEPRTTRVFMQGSHFNHHSIELPLPTKRATGRLRRVVKVKRGPGKGRVRKSWLRAYPVKFTFVEDNGSPIIDLFRTWIPTVIYPAEYTEKTL